MTPTLWLGSDMNLMPDGEHFISPDITTLNLPTPSSGTLPVGIVRQCREQISANLVSNPNFATDTSSWTAGSGATISRVTGVACPGGFANACQIVGTGSSNSNIGQSVGPLVYPGQRLRVEFWARLVSGDSGWVTPGLSSSALFPVQVMTLTASWKRFTSSVVASLAGSAVKFYVYQHAASGTASTAQFTGFHVSNMTTDPYVRAQRYEAIDGTTYARSSSDSGTTWTDWAQVAGYTDGGDGTVLL